MKVVPIAQASAAYKALWLRLNYSVIGAYQIEPYYPYDRWELDEDEVQNEVLKPKLKDEIAARLEIYTKHFVNAGFIRADATFGRVFGAPSYDDDGEVTLYLAFEGDKECADTALRLADFGIEQVELAVDAGATLSLSAQAEIIDIGTLFSALLASQPADAIGMWGGPATPDLMPGQGESLSTWCSRVSISSERLTLLFEGWERSGRNVQIFPFCGASRDVSDEGPIEWIVPGLIARGSVTLLVGSNMSGKSTMLAELAAVVDGSDLGERSFLGVKIEGSCLPVTVSGEDTKQIARARAGFFQSRHGPNRGFWIDGAAQSWRETLAYLRAIPNPGLIIVDPVRAFLDGNEDSSGVVSLFYDDLTDLAREKNCAVIAVHHFSKGTPRSIANVLTMVRGSGVHTDRARMVIAMIKRSEAIIEVGIIKHNYPPSERMWGRVNEGRMFNRDAATLTLLPAEAAQSTAADASAADVGGRILSALIMQSQEGVVVRRTGRSELFELKPALLMGLSRQTIRHTVASLIEKGSIAADGGGALSVPAQLSVGEAG